MGRKNKIILLVFLALFSFQIPPFMQLTDVEAKSSDLVYIVPVEQDIERGLEQFLKRAFKEAEQYDADMIVLEINTLGGEVGAALGIGELIQDSSVPVTAYVKGEAISAGSYIALNADYIYMQPESHIGAAAPRTITGEEADPKTTSLWASHMETAAKSHNRNAEIAVGMVDSSVEIPGITEKGQLITLDSEEAVEYKMADGIVDNQQKLLNQLNLADATIEEIEPTPAEKLARFVTNPYVIPFLLIIGIAGIVIEIFVPGFGLPGIVGILSFGFYFFGHYIAGFAGWEALSLFILGFILMLVELFIPSFGIFGITGIIAFGFGISLAAYDTQYGLISLVIALIINVILFVILIKYFGHKGVWNKFILNDEQKKNSGYVSHTKNKDLIGKQGKTITKLRPSGAIIIEGKRYDVVSEGNFIDVNIPIEVIFIDGTKIVVQEVENKE